MFVWFFSLYIHFTYSNKFLLLPPGQHPRNINLILIICISVPLLNHWYCNIYLIAGETYVSVSGDWFWYVLSSLTIPENCLEATDLNNSKWYLLKISFQEQKMPLQSSPQARMEYYEDTEYLVNTVSMVLALGLKSKYLDNFLKKLMLRHRKPFSNLLIKLVYGRETIKDIWKLLVILMPSQDGKHWPI